MTISLKASDDGLSGTIALGGVDKVTIDSSGIASGVGQGSALLNIGTPFNSTSGISNTWNIPAWAKRITLSLQGVSTNSTGIVGVQVGTGAALTTSGYAGTAFSATASYVTMGSMFSLQGANAAATVISGSVVLTLIDAATNTWTMSAVIGQSNAAAAGFAAGSVSLAGALDIVGIVVSSGAFDAGKINILYE